MQGTSRLLSLCLCLVFGLAAVPSAAGAQTADRPIVLAQQERPSIFRHLFRRRGREVPMTPNLQRRLDRRQQQLRAPDAPQPKAARPQRKKRAAERPSKKREAARPAKRRNVEKPAKQREQAKPRKERRSRPAEAAPKPVQAVDKAADARKVLVLGDFMAGQLAKGLSDTYSDNANLAVIDANKGDSGLVRADHYDWPKELLFLVEEHKPDAIVMMVGANDRQSIATEAGSQQLGSEGWRTAYGSRVSALASALKATGKPVLWTGLTPVRPGQMSRDYSAMNGIVRETLEREGLRFVDTWNGFADEEGRFAAAGPDVEGQQVQLRSKDGLNFTKSGQRKLAFFLEADLNSIMGGGGPAGGVPQVATLDALAGPPPELVRQGAPLPWIGPMVPIEALTAGGDALSGAGPAPGVSGAASDAVLQRLAAEGASAPSGRADNFAQASLAPAADPAPVVQPVASEPVATPAASAPAAVPAAAGVVAAPAQPTPAP